MKVFSWRAYLKSVLGREFYSDEDVKQIMKRIFDKDSWQFRCEGKTEKQMKKAGWVTVDKWMVEK